MECLCGADVNPFHVTLDHMTDLLTYEFKPLPYCATDFKVCKNRQENLVAYHVKCCYEGQEDGDTH